MKRKILTSMLVSMVIVFGALVQAQDAEVKEEVKKEAKEKTVPGKADTLKWAEASFHYVGEKKCKMCHKVQFKTWSETRHAKAWESLKPEEQKKPECIECHSTGMNKKDSLLVTVSCEACHGPGSDYKKNKTMKDPKLASAAGLLPINEATCVRCHNEKSPTFKGFEYAEALKTGVHGHPAEEEAKEKE